MTIGDALRKERENLDLTQKEMVEGTSISVSHYSKIENDIQDIKAKDLFELLDARKIDVNNFRKKIIDKKRNSLNELADQLTKAFYKPDIKLAKAVKEQLADFSDAEELQIRAELVVAVLTNNLKETKQELSAKLINYFERDATLMNKLLVKYQKIDQYPLDTQKRIGNIFVNYLHVLYDYRAKRMARKYINFLQNLPGIPELTLDKLMGDYYDAVFFKNEKELAQTLSVLKRVVPKIVSGLPEK